jgi:hypothetical protein
MAGEKTSAAAPKPAIVVASSAIRRVDRLRRDARKLPFMYHLQKNRSVHVATEGQFRVAMFAPKDGEVSVMVKWKQESCC